MRLLTIPFSHFCEKARWALDFAGVCYQESAFLPGQHMLPMRRAGGKTVPLLVADDGRVFADSTDIVRYVDTLKPGVLFPTATETAAHERAAIDQLEEDFDRHLGPASRRWAYCHLLKDTRVASELLGRKLRRSQRVGLRILFPLVRPLIRKRYRVNPVTCAKAVEAIEETFARVSLTLQSDPSRYLVGNSFSAADIAFASLAAPVVLPPRHPAMSFDVDDVPIAMQSLVRSVRATPAGEFVLRLYREYRDVRRF